MGLGEAWPRGLRAAACLLFLFRSSYPVSKPSTNCRSDHARAGPSAGAGPAPVGRPATPAPPRLQTQAHTPRYRSHESPTTAPALTVAQRHRKAPRSAVQPTAGDRAVVLLGWPCIAQQKQPQGLSSGQVERSEFERRLACQKARCSRAEQWMSYSCTGVQPCGVAPRGTSQTCRPGGSPGRSYGVILWLRRGVAPCEVRAAMTARSVCPLLRTELGTWCRGPSDTLPGFSRIVVIL